MKRTIFIAFVLVVSQPLLVGAGVLTKWVIECGDGACAGTVYATSPFGPLRDALLTALAVAAPYLLAVLVAAVTWLLTSRTVAQPVTEPFPASPALLAVDRTLAGGTGEWQGRRRIAAASPRATGTVTGSLPLVGAGSNGNSKRTGAFRAEGTEVPMRQKTSGAKL